MLVDAATAADHRQQPTGFGILPSSDAGPKPYAALRHAVTKPRLFLPRVRSGAAIVAARIAALAFSTAIVPRPAAAMVATLAGIENVFGRRKLRAIDAGQRRGDILGRPLGEQRARQCQVVLGRLLGEDH